MGAAIRLLLRRYGPICMSRNSLSATTRGPPQAGADLVRHPPPRRRDVGGREDGFDQEDVAASQSLRKGGAECGAALDPYAAATQGLGDADVVPGSHPEV